MNVEIKMELRVTIEEGEKLVVKLVNPGSYPYYEETVIAEDSVYLPVLRAAP